MADMPCELAEDDTHLVASEDRVPNIRIKVDGVVVATSIFAHLQHAGPAQVTNDAPDCAAGHAHRFDEVTSRTVGVCCDAGRAWPRG